MGSFDYNDDYSSFDNLLNRTISLTEARQSGLSKVHPSFGTLTGKLRDVGSTAFTRDSRKFVVDVLYTTIEPNIITDEELDQLKAAGPEAGPRYKIALQGILDNHKDEITERSDEIGQVVEDRFPAFANDILGRGPQRIQGNIDARKARIAAKEIADDIKQGEDIDDSVEDALDSVLVQAAINKVLTNIQTSLGEPGLDIEEEALQEVVDYAERIQTVDELADFVRQIAKEPGYQKIALYLSAVVKPLRGNKPDIVDAEKDIPTDVRYDYMLKKTRWEKDNPGKQYPKLEDEEGEEDESAPYRSMYEPGDSGNAYEEGESEAQSTEVEDEEVISREGLNSNMRKRKLLFEKKKNWNRFRSEDEKELVVEKDLNAAERRSLPNKDFALPGKGEGPEGKQAGSYPIPDESHARSALSLVSQHGTPEEKKKVRAAVASKFPGINQEEEEVRADLQRGPMLDSYQSDTSGYLSEQVTKDKRNTKSKVKNESFKERYKPKTHWQLQELRRRGL